LFDPWNMDVCYWRQSRRGGIAGRSGWLKRPLHFGDEFFFVQSEVARVLANEALGEYSGGQFIELFFFDGFQKPGGDSQFVRDLVQFEVTPAPFAT